MAPLSTKPESVLKQAEALVAVGQQNAALQTLTEVFSSKRFRSVPIASLEPIMLRLLELSVDMRRGRTAKEGLMQYKNLAQNTSVPSIEVVVKKFLANADSKVVEAQAQAEKAVLDVDDLEASETPEDVLLGAVSGDQSKDRTDRALVTPWLKFSWESYRTALETLKNNARLEIVYQVRSFEYSSVQSRNSHGGLLVASGDSCFQVLLEVHSQGRVPPTLRDPPSASRQCREIRQSAWAAVLDQPL